MSTYMVPRTRLLTRFQTFRNHHQTVIGQQKQQRYFSQAKSKHPTTIENNAITTKDTHGIPILSSSSSSSASRKILGVNTKLFSGKQETNQQENIQVQRHVLLRWTGSILRWAPIGFGVFGIFEWQSHKKRCKQEKLPRTASEFQSNVYCSLPLRIVSRCWGWLAACYVPVVMRPYIYGFYANTFKVNLDEAFHPEYEHYNSLSEFFTRPLKDGVRVIDNQAPLVSPADGKVLHFGSATNAHIEQVKGVNYNIQDFLGAPTNERESDDDYIKAIKRKHDDSTALYQCVIYLAPGDYHRFHSPASWQPTVRRHFSGELLSVSPKIASWLPGLFCLNERVLYMGSWKYGFFSYTAVGATNVGSVEIFTDEKLKTNRWVGLKVGTHKKLRDCDELVLDSRIQLNKGEPFGQFNMGSTIVLIFEAPKNFKFDIVEGQKIHVGEPLGHIVESNRR